jgi:hypothetical protein
VRSRVAIAGALGALAALRGPLPGEAWSARPRPQAAAQPTPAASPAAPSQDPLELIRRLEQAWQARDLQGYLALWDATAPRGEERAEAAVLFTAEQTELRVQPPRSVPRAAEQLRVSAEIFSVTEPRASVQQWLLTLRRQPQGWLLASRTPVAAIDGLIHLTLDPTAYRADGMRVRLEDFELQVRKGTLFTSPATIGPTALVFVGDAQVRFSPGPATEKEQLRQFCGKPELVERVRAALLRIHPADLHRVLSPVRLDPDPAGGSRLAAARRFFADQSPRSFLLDATLPRSPWWLLPSLGDASINIQTARRGTLTFTVSSSEPEDLSLFDRERRRQICLYPSGGRDTRYNEDDRRAADVIHHDLQVRFDPARYGIEAEDTLRLALRAPTATLRLRLDDTLRVESVRSAEAGNHLFFRVRGQDSLMVSLGALAGAQEPFSLTVRYAGTHRPEEIDREVIQAPGQAPYEIGDEDIPIDEILAYTNRTAWYPNAGNDDYAHADLRFDVPNGYTVLTGGERTAARVEGNRTLIEYSQREPGKYITAAVGRLVEVTRRQSGPLSLAAYAVARTRGEAENMLSSSEQILAFYAELFGPCPYPTLNLALIEGRTPGGHSPPGMVLLAQRPLLFRRPLRDDPANFSDVPGFFLAHELAHQWWGHGVSGQNYRERWISEAFAQYAAALWVRHSRGEEAFRGVLTRIGRWALRETDEGPIHLGYRLGHLREDPQVFRAVVYDKGAYVLHMVRGIVGEEPFAKGLRLFQQRYRYAKAGTEELRLAFEEVSGRELSAYFREWVLGTSLPRLTWSWSTRREGASFRTSVEVTAEALPGPVPLQVTLLAGSERTARSVSLQPGSGKWTFETAVAPRKVEINADRGLLARIDGP